jgi:hypothetical protein
MDEGFATQQDQVLARFTSLLSCALTVNEQGGLVHYPDSQPSSEQFLKLISPLVTNDEVFCFIPSLSLKKKRPPSATREKASMEIAAASSLAELEGVSKIEVRNIPSILVHNIVKSFMSLVQSRVRSYLTALALQSRKDPSSRLSPIVEMLSGISSDLVKPNTIVSSYRIKGASTRAHDKWISPLIQETVIDLNVLGEVISVIISGSGSICGVFDDSGSPPTITKVSLFIDTADFLRSMMAKARDAVKRATSKISLLFLNSMTQSAHPVPHGIMAPSNNMLERNQQTSLHSIQTPNVDLPVQSNLEFNSGMPPPRRRDPSSISLQSFPQPEKHQNHHSD